MILLFILSVAITLQGLAFTTVVWLRNRREAALAHTPRLIGRGPRIGEAQVRQTLAGRLQGLE